MDGMSDEKAKEIEAKIKEYLKSIDAPKPHTFLGFPIVVREFCHQCNRFIDDGEIHGHG